VEAKLPGNQEANMAGRESTRLQITEIKTEAGSDGLVR
jgi:hypothetical protein